MSTSSQYNSTENNNSFEMVYNWLLLPIMFLNTSYKYLCGAKFAQNYMVRAHTCLLKGASLNIYYL